MIITNGTLFCDDGVFRQMDIEARGGIITNIGDDLPLNGPENIDAADCYVVPGFIDIHIHGAAGADFNDCGTNASSVNTMARFLLKNGVTGFLGTSLTLSEAALSDIYAHVSVGKVIPGQSTLLGINMEGPFFNMEKRGAQNADYIMNPNFDMFTRLYEECESGIRTVAVAPELPGGLDFIKKASRICNVSIGHSAADYNTAMAAFEAGANSITHIFNGMTAFHHREPGIIGAAADSGVYAELICDGLHLHPSMVRAVFKLFGDDKICLISDALRACGLPEGDCDIGGQSATIKNGVAMLADGTLAGSIITLADCVRNAVKFGISLESALKAATINPAKLAGLSGSLGSLTTGKQADILILNKDLSLKCVIQRGTPTC